MIYLLIYFGLVAWILYIKGTPIFRFDQFSTLSWLFSTFLGSLGLIVQRYSLSWETILLVVVCHTLMVLAFGFTHKRSKNKYQMPERTSDVYRNILIIFPMLFIALAMGRAFLAGGLPILSAVGNIELAREAFWLEGRSGLDRVIQGLIYSTIPYVIYFSFGKKNKLDYLVFLGTTIFIIDSALRDGGRAMIVFMLISAVAIFFSTRKIKLKSSILYGFIGVFSIYMLSSQFYLARNSDFGNNVNFYISHNCNGGSLARPIKGSPLSVQALALSSCYFSSPLYTFDRMNKDWNKHYGGAYNGGIILGEQFEAARRDIENYFAARSLARNPWATSVRDVWLDFGSLAPLLFIAIGILMAKIGVLPRNGSPTQVARFGLVASLAFMMPFQSPFILRYLVYPIAFTYVVDFMVVFIGPYLRAKRLKPARRTRDKIST